MKKAERFRNYTDSAKQEVITNTYNENHHNMTLEHVLNMHNKWLQFNHGSFSIEEVLELVDTVVDDSDPDTNFPNTVHAFQTAEGLRERFPELDWLHLVGLLHDLGKVMCCWGEPQWNVVGDTYPVGCAFSDKILFSEFFANNPDSQDPRYNTASGVYSWNCGLSNVLMSWGHDEYMYQILKHNCCTIPAPGLFIVRYHSFYPWHTDDAYGHLTDINDIAMAHWVTDFNEHDLYTKSAHSYDNSERKHLWDSYYKELCDKYGLGGKLQW